MKVRIQRTGTIVHPPLAIEDIESVVLCDDYAQPIFLAVKQGDGQVITAKAGDSRFASMLKVLGIGLNATVTTSTLR